jgi:hypothetical protein
LALPVTLTFDMGNWLWVGDSPEEAARHLAPAVSYIHVKAAEPHHSHFRAVAPDAPMRAGWRCSTAACRCPARDRISAGRAGPDGRDPPLRQPVTRGVSHAKDVRCHHDRRSHGDVCRHRNRRAGEVEHFMKRVAGAELNVATGLARLGLNVGWVSRVGDDSFGRFVLIRWRKRGLMPRRHLDGPLRYRLSAEI